MTLTALTLRARYISLGRSQDIGTPANKNFLDRIERAWHVTQLLANGRMIDAETASQASVLFYARKPLLVDR